MTPEHSGYTAFLRQIVGGLGGAVLIAGRDGGILSAAGEPPLLGGRTPGSLGGTPVSALFAESDRPSLDSWIANAPAGGTIGLISLGGGRLEAAISIVPLDAGRVAICIRESNSDAEARERQRYENVGQLASGIAHGFNNLLTGVLGNLRIAVDSLGGTPAAAAVEDATRAAERAADLTRQLLLLSGGGEPVREPVLVPDAIVDMSRLLHTTIAPKVQVRLDVDSDLPPVFADPVQLRQAILTLMMNGARAIGEDAGTLMVRATAAVLDSEMIDARFAGQGLKEGRVVLFEIRDTGRGIEASTERLSLASVRASIREHGGALSVESARGQGTTFRVVLPASSEPAPAPAEPPRARTIVTHPAGTVLVVDDEDMVTRLARSILTKAGYPVLVASSGEEAIQLFEAGASAVALVVLDLTMAGFSCEEMLARMRSIRPDLPVTLASGYPEKEVMKRFAAHAGLNFLQKPFTKAQLLDRVAAAIGVATPR